VRAYAGAAESVLSEVGREVQQTRAQALLSFDFADEQPIRHWCENNEGVVEQIDYGTQVQATISLPETVIGDFTAFCEARKLDYRFET